MSYQLCPHCANDRSAGNLARAIHCGYCDGKGIRREPWTYICNQCGEQLCPSNSDSPYGLVDAKVSGGYNSSHLTDLTSYTFSLCESCLRRMFNTFKRPPKMEGAVSDYEEDLDLHNHWVWKCSDGPRNKLLDGICNGRERCLKPAMWRHFVSGHMTDESFCEEHKSGAANSCFVPALEIEPCMPLDASKRSHEEKDRIATAYLRARVRSTVHVTSFRYLDTCLAEAVGRDPNETGGLFFPHGASELEFNLMTRMYKLNTRPFPVGVLFYGDQAEVHKIARDGLNRGIVPVKVLQGLPDADADS